MLTGTGGGNIAVFSFLFSMIRLGCGVTSPSSPRGVVSPSDSGVEVDEEDGEIKGIEASSSSLDMLLAIRVLARCMVDMCML